MNQQDHEQVAATVRRIDSDLASLFRRYADDSFVTEKLRLTDWALNKLKLTLDERYRHDCSAQDSLCFRGVRS